MPEKFPYYPETAYALQINPPRVEVIRTNVFVFTLISTTTSLGCLRGRTSEYLIAPTNAWPDLLVLGLGVAVGIEVGLVLCQNTP